MTVFGTRRPLVRVQPPRQNDFVAQLVELVTVNHPVVGSSPTKVAYRGKTYSGKLRLLIEWMCKHWGSGPLSSAIFLYLRPMENGGNRLNKYRSLEGRLKAIYNKQSTSSKKRGHKPQSYTREEFIQKFISDPDYIKIHEKWVDNKYSRETSPSIDRICDKCPYTFENIRLTDWKTNREKESRSKQKYVNRISKKGNCIKQFESASQAAREMGCCQSEISKVCRGERESILGAYFEYAQTHSVICVNNHLHEEIYKMNILSPKQEKFCNFYVKHGNATLSAVKSGYSKRTATSIGSENLKKLIIIQRIEDLQCQEK